MLNGEIAQSNLKRGHYYLNVLLESVRRSIILEERSFCHEGSSIEGCLTSRTHKEALPSLPKLSPKHLRSLLSTLPSPISLFLILHPFSLLFYLFLLFFFSFFLFTFSSSILESTMTILSLRKEAYDDWRQTRAWVLPNVPWIDVLHGRSRILTDLTYSSSSLQLLSLFFLICSLSSIVYIRFRESQNSLFYLSFAVSKKIKK